MALKTIRVSGAGGSGIYMVFFLISELVRPNVPNTSTKTATMQPVRRPRHDARATIIPHPKKNNALHVPALFQGPTFGRCSRRWVRSASLSASSLSLCYVMRSIAAKQTLNSSGEIRFFLRSSCAPLNDSWHTPSPHHTQALNPSSTSRTTSIICSGGTTKQGSTCKRSVRSAGW